ncbi:MAG: N-acetyltransferase [Deltaproteobacteria bacterium]|nr:N-acetyltransferase [Deltaproteobacteria bacterium]
METDREITIEPMKAEDWPAVKAIYQQGIDTGNATFETSVPEWRVWDRNHLDICRLVAREAEAITGWVALSRVSIRDAYAGVCEVSVYIAPETRGSGVGTMLLNALVHESERNGIWTLEARIFPENTTSLKLHGSCGFREVGIHERIGRMSGTWRNTVLMERRSKAVGT